MSQTMQTEKAAVECGYWTMYRYNPLLEEKGKNPFSIDSKEPDFDKYLDFGDTSSIYVKQLKITLSNRVSL